MCVWTCTITPTCPHTISLPIAGGYAHITSCWGRFHPPACFIQTGPLTQFDPHAAKKKDGISRVGASITLRVCCFFFVFAAVCRLCFFFLRFLCALWRSDASVRSRGAAFMTTAGPGSLDPFTTLPNRSCPPQNRCHPKRYHHTRHPPLPNAHTHTPRWLKSTVRNPTGCGRCAFDNSRGMKKRRRGKGNTTRDENLGVSAPIQIAAIARSLSDSLSFSWYWWLLCNVCDHPVQAFECTMSTLMAGRLHT